MNDPLKKVRNLAVWVLLSSVLTRPAAAQSGVTFAASTETAQPQSTVSVSIRVTDFTQVTTAQGSLLWNPAVLQFLSVGNFGLPDLSAASFGTNNAPQGRLAFSWDDSSLNGVTAADGTVIFTLEFSVLGANGSSSPVAFGKDPRDTPPLEVTVNLNVVSFIAVDGTVGVGTQPPTLSDIPQQFTLEDTATAPIPFTVGDAETAPAQLTLTKASSDQILVPDANISIEGADANRTVTITPAPDRFGTVFITITVRDSDNAEVSKMFQLTVGPVNDPPVLTLPGPSVTYLPGDSPVLLDDSATVTDVDSAHFGSGKLEAQLLNGGTADDRLIVRNQGTGSGQIGLGGESVTLRVSFSGLSGAPISAHIHGPAAAGDSAAVLYDLGPFAQFNSDGGSILGTAVLSDPGGYTVAQQIADLQAGLWYVNVHSSTFPGGEIRGQIIRNDLASADFMIELDGAQDGGAGRTGAGNGVLRLGNSTVLFSGAPIGSLIGGGNPIDPLDIVFNANATPGAVQALTRNLAFANVNPEPVSGPRTVGIRVADDGNAASAEATKTVNVGVIPPVGPSISDIPDQAIAEDGTLAPVPFVISDPDTPLDSLTLMTASSNPALVDSSGIQLGGAGANRTIAATPLPNQFGVAEITITVSDDVSSASDSFLLTVTAVNDPPSFDAIADLSLAANPGPQTVVLTGIQAGPPNEIQALQIIAVSSNPALIPIPTINYTSPNTTGSLVLSPLSNVGGTAVITVTVNDGQTSNNSFSRAFTVTVATPNRPPTLNPIADLTINENSSQQTVGLSGIGSGAADEAQLVTLSAVSSNPGLIPHPLIVHAPLSFTATLLFTPVPNATGTATITVTANDGQPQNNLTSRSFAVTVQPVNEAPVLVAVPPQTVVENSALRLTLIATDPDPGDQLTFSLVTGPTGAALDSSSGLLTWTPTEDQGPGTSEFTVQAQDNGNPPLVARQTFFVEVLETNSPPVLAAIADQTVAEGSLLALAVIATDPDLPANLLSFQLNAAPSGMTINPATAVILWAPTEADGPGTNIVSVTVTDDGDPPLTASVSFLVIVTEVFSEPVLGVVPDQVTPEDTPTQLIPIPIADPDTAPDRLVLTAASSNSSLVPLANLIVSGTGLDRGLTITPAPDQFGSTLITLSLNDGFQTTTATFTLRVTEVNDPPIARQDEQRVRQDTVLIFPAATLVLNDSPGPANEVAQDLLVTGVSAATAGGGTVALVGGNVEYRPPSGFVGMDSFSYTAVDDGTTAGVADPRSATGTVLVNVTPVNQPPVAADDARATPEDTALSFPATDLLANDAAEPVASSQSLILTGVSSSSAQGGSVVLEAGSIEYAPPSDFNGIDTFTYTVQDDGLTDGLPDPKSATGTVSVMVTEVNDPPAARADSKTALENQPLSFPASELVGNDLAGPANEAGQALSVISVAPASAQGAAVSLAGGIIQYIPPADFAGTDSFNYNLQDNGTTAGAPDPKTASGQVEITVNAVVPRIVSGPDSLRIRAGSPASFAVIVSGQPPFTFQWLFNGNPISGANGQSLLLAAVSASDGGGYSVRVNNAFGSAESPVAILAVLVAPSILVQPQDLTVTEGSPGSFTVLAAGSEPLVYQWRHNSQPLSSPSLPVLVLGNLLVSQSGQYDVVISNEAGSVTSAAASLTVEGIITITEQPAGTNVLVGGNAAFRVAALGAAPLLYQWRQNGVEINDATNSVLELANVQPDDSGAYDVIITNPEARVESAAALLVVVEPPEIAAHPSDTTVRQGTDAGLLVIAHGTDPLQYQWRKGGQPINGANTASLALDQAQPADAGMYDVVVSNLAGSVTSQVAVVTVLVPPSIVQQPASQTGFVGGSAAFSVRAEGDPTLSYQWKKDGVDISGANNDSLDRANLQTEDAGQYTVEVRNASGVALSQEATLVVNVPVQITVPPASQVTTNGGIARFEVAAVGTKPLTYQWRQNGIDLPGATGTMLVISNVQAPHASDYDVVVSNVVGPVTSPTATLTILQPPAIGEPPQDARVALGSTVTFSVTATGDEPLTYQWTKNGGNIQDATNRTFTIANVQREDAANYNVVVANIAGAVTSPTATLSLVFPALFLADNIDDLRVSTITEGTFDGGTNRDATREADEPNHAGRRAEKSMWFGLQAPDRGRWIIDTKGSNFDTLLAAYRGTRGLGLVPLAADDDSGGFSTSEISVSAEPGDVIKVAVDGFDAATGNIVLGIRFEVSPRPFPAILAQPGSQTATPGGLVIFSVLTTNATTFEWFFRRGTVISPIPSPNGFFLVVQNISTNDVGQYFVRVGNGIDFINSAEASLQILIGDTVPSEDKFATAAETASSISLQSVPARTDRRKTSLARGFSGTQIFNTFGASKEQGEPNHCGVVGGASQWFAYQAPTNGVLRISTEGSDYDTVLAVYTGPGTDFESLLEAACDNDSGADGRTSVALLPATTGTIYYVAVDGVGGAQGTVELTYSLGQAPAISQQPISQSVPVGGNVALSISVTDAFSDLTTNLPPVSYQWFQNDLPVASATNSLLLHTNVQAAQAGAYRVVARNFAGPASSADASILVNVPITITAQPQNQRVTANQTAQFSVSASGSAPLSYQWFRDAAPLASATNAVLQLAGVQPADAGTYRVTVNNSVATVQSDPATLDVTAPPSLTSPPQGLAVVLGNPANFGVVAAGTAPFTYQWRFNGAAIPGATNAAFARASVQAGHAGNYSVIVNNEAGSIVSPEARLTIVVPVAITRPPQNIAAAAGETVRFSVLASGTEPLSYQWRFNSQNLPGANAPTLTLTNVGPASQGAYSVQISNAANSVTSADATLTVGPDLIVRAGAVGFLPDGRFQIQFSGPVGRSILVQASTDQLNWSTVATLAFVGGTATFVDDASPTFQLRFYRAVLVGN